MSAAAMPKFPAPIVVLLAIAAAWFLTQRRAGAAQGGGGVTPAPTWGNQEALRNPAVQAYRVPINGAVPAVSAPGDPLSAFLGFMGSVIRPSASTPGISASRVPLVSVADAAAAPTYGGIIRPAGYEPQYIPDQRGEAVAQAYALEHPELFVSNPPPTYLYNSGVDPDAGFLDNQ